MKRVSERVSDLLKFAWTIGLKRLRLRYFKILRHLKTVLNTNIFKSQKNIYFIPPPVLLK